MRAHWGTLLVSVLAALASPALIGASIASSAPRLEPLSSPVTVRLRGLSAVSDQIAWASGREGTVLRTVDGGKSWSVFRVQGAEALDFRDVQGFGADEALVMGAGPGDASRMYRTSDGGAHWVLVLRNPDANGFFDCMDFDQNEGRLLGDPVDGRFTLFRSTDRGRSWTRMAGPKAAKDEAAFAASGTCVLRHDKGTLVVTGGSRARVHYLPDHLVGIADWHALDAPFERPGASKGLFSIASREDFLIASGGDYQHPSLPPVQLALNAGQRMPGCAVRATPRHFKRVENEERLSTTGGRRPWCDVTFGAMTLFEGSPGGYRSGVACAGTGDPVCIATGPDGTDVLPPDGPDSNSVGRAGRWAPLSDTGYDSVASAGNIFWFSGDRLGKLELTAQP